ncbi:AMP-binding protein [Gordonia pseudamarae]|uniref:AMP-binding protein n=1 Tax=Gordonia pseudamarae TaxID=2831662 RepID=A0ABX6IFC3_9ACTN|nr:MULTISPECIES: AMP-binding protein [Gordonia]MBD0020555.1 AMP-binding protein [Gordonia sp. (in: high G+C Gram-positive bacteria)]QHN25613.1 AMP-binding protein [Gordonia pseudamarae]QHN34546.1 AMP-binding protein [Gordonia pseudamarae]
MTNTVPSTVDTAVAYWLARYGAADADAAHLLVDRHDPTAAAFISVALDEAGALVTTPITYGELADDSRRLATALAGLGVGTGTRVGVLMGKRAELVVTLLALARLGAVYIPLFTAFATPAIEMRLRGGGASIVVTETGQADKLTPIDGLTTIVAGDTGVLGFDTLVAGSEPLAESVAVGGDGHLILLFTSGTTGTPKGVPVPMRALASFRTYMRYGLDVRDDDVFWNAADPGWAYGLYYGILGPLVIGRPNILLQAGFSPEITAKVFAELGVTNFAAAPTVYRSLSKTPAVDGFGLRRASSAGEPLTPDVIGWARTALGTEVRDHYGQTEHGMFINNHWADELRAPLIPGSMGWPMPGFATGIVREQIAIDVPASPAFWFPGYLDAPEKTAARYTDDGRWYLTGDTGRVDEDGNFYFSARDDDVIIMAGYRIGPFDVESVLITHPSVIDVAVVGRPDELRGEVLEAFVVLAEGLTGDDALETELQQLVKTGFAAHAYPRTVHFVESLPKTPSGKIQRFLLRRRE